jgi:hypothetical protein
MYDVIYESEISFLYQKILLQLQVTPGKTQ